MRVGIIGIGLIGGSIGKALKKYGGYEVWGCDKDGTAVKRAIAAQACDRAFDESEARELDVLIIALREGDTLRTLEKFAPLLRDGSTVFDVCGVKRSIVARMRDLKEKYPNIDFCGVHPMAGKERGGIDHSSAELFKNAYVIAVPIGGGVPSVVRDIFAKAGARGIKVASAEEHDYMIAYTSQLAHVASGCYVKDPRSATHSGFSAGSFRDLTRVARLDADMWTELFLDNADNLLDCIDCMAENLAKYREAIANADADALHALLVESTRCKENADACRAEVDK